MESTEKILLHMCCAPCSVYTVGRLREKGFVPEGYFYNPNIHPYDEFKMRLKSARDFGEKAGMKIHEREEYGLREYLEEIVGEYEKPGRCARCYRMRIKTAVDFAADRGFSKFTTTLLYSVHQYHEAIAGISREYCAIKGIEFVYMDFRIGWRDGVIESKRMNLYRQKYCGCIFSEYERHERKRAGKPWAEARLRAEI